MSRFDPRDLYAIERKEEQRKLDLTAARIKVILLEAEVEVASTEQGRVFVTNDYGMESDI